MDTTADRKNSRILVVDDEPGIRSLLSYELGQEGYTVVTADNGADGLELLRKDRFHLVISDIRMPRMDGLELLAAIKKIDPDIEVILVTGYGTIGTAVAAIKQGAYDFIQKPFNLRELVALVERALEKAELRTLAALYDTSRAIFSSVRLEELLPLLADRSRRFLKADDISIILLNDGQELSIAASCGLKSEEDRHARLQLAEHAIRHLIDYLDCPVITGPLEQDPRFAAISGIGSIRSSIVCPLAAHSRALGVLCAVRSGDEVPFSTADRRSAGIFSAQVSQAIDNAQLYRTLEEKIGALDGANRRLTEMRTELVQAEKLAAIGELSAGVAHELNNPLTIISGLSELLLDGDAEPPDRRKDLRSIREQAERCRAIILNLLQFAQKNEARKKPADVNDILEKAIELWSYNLHDSRVEMVRDFDPALPPVTVNVSQLQQVFLNILNNAQHAMHGTERRPRLSIRTERTEEGVSISFSDNGCGIPEQHLGRIFDPFFTTKGVGKGTGLGLSISYGIVHDHGGEIRVRSVLGEGSTFTVDLPCAGAGEW